jgi:hypothetical protein
MPRNIRRGGSCRDIVAPVNALPPPLVASAALALALATIGCTTLPRAPAEEPEEVQLPGKRHGQAVRNDAPEISKSRGERGGYVVLWPRIVPRDDDPTTLEIASLLQARLRSMAEKAAPGAPVDVRPDPERACPRDGGCVATSLGAVLSRKGGACAAAATIGAPGTSPVRVLGWAGTVTTKDATAGFRDPPESLLVVQEWAKCEDLLAQLRSNAAPSDETEIAKAVAAGAAP